MKKANSVSPRISTNCASFLKWAGGKQWLVSLLDPLIRYGSGKYFEPFLGGGSVFFALRPKQALLSDSNPELIATYRAVRKDPEAVIRHLRRLSFSMECFYRVRSSRPRSPFSRAARFIYLNRMCWNGLYRVNRNGDFNVPMGKFEYSPNFEALSERIRIAARPLRRAQLQCLDFENACALAEPGDTVYLDPPYSVSHEGNGFLRYNERVFSWDDQKRLALLAAQLASKACRIVISNANHPSIIALYPGFEKTVVCRRSLVAGVVTSRKGVTELVISNFVCLHPAFVTAFNKALQVRQ